MINILKNLGIEDMDIADGDEDDNHTNNNSEILWSLTKQKFWRVDFRL
jgi:hypothetical protein